MTHSRQEAALALLLAALLQAPAAKAQAGAAGKMQSRESSPETAKGVHRFWDKENLLLFTGVAAGRALDFTSTQHFRERGLDEWLLTNGIVDNKPLFTGIEMGGVAASIGVSYLFHRTGHHKLERWVSIVHFGVGVGGAIRNYSLKAPAPSQ